MNADFEQFRYCQGNPLFYTEPTAETDVSPRFTVSLPPEWFEHEADGWLMRAPTARADVPEQGWKVHVSARGEDAAAALAAAGAVCHQHATAFKHLVSRKELFLRNSKNYPREHAGKFITCYPREADLPEFLAHLESALQGLQGPYILSDKRWKIAPVYLRYGSFRRLTVEVDGQETPAIRTPEGRLIPDERGATFNVPTWATIPPCLAQWIDAYDDDAELFVPPFSINSSIKFSNGGGTYRATSTDGELRPFIVKEARPHAGLDAQSRTAVDRLTVEQRALTELEATGFVPRVEWSGTLWEHHFLCIEELPGVTLQKWIGRNFPVYGDASELEQYYGHVLAFGRTLIEAVRAIHDRGWAHQDLHPRNIIVTSVEDASLTLIDFEAACPLSDSVSSQDFGFPGFRSLTPRTPEQIDWFGAHQIVAYMTLPLINLTELNESYSTKTFTFAAGRGMSRAAAVSPKIMLKLDDLRQTLARLAQPDSHSRPDYRPLASATPSPLLGSPARTLRDLRESTRSGLQVIVTSPLSTGLPVHYEGLSDGPSGLAYGAAGILTALSAAADTAGTGSRVAHERLVDATRNSLHNSGRRGLFTGDIGDLVGLDSAGNHGEVTDYLVKHGPSLFDGRGVRVYDGLPGDLLGLMRLCTTHPHPDRRRIIGDRLPDEIARLSHRYAADPTAFSPVGTPGKLMANQSRYQDSGLLYGHLGLAWLFALAAKQYARDEWIDTALCAVQNELTRYKLERGRLQFEQAGRLLPYLATGSAGFGVVLPLLPPKRVSADLGDAPDQLLAATELDFCSSAGLFNGFAGLMIGNAGLRSVLGRDPASPHEHVAGLEVHSLRLNGSHVFGGDSEFRLSGDLATGAAGILLATSLNAHARSTAAHTRSLIAPAHPERRPISTP